MEFIHYLRRCIQVFICIFVAGALFLSLPLVAMAETQPGSGDWYRLRTNHVPFRPAEINLDVQGRLWMCAVEEYAPAVWRLDPQTGTVDYISNSRKNNNLKEGYVNFLHKPQLDAEVVYVQPDPRGNTWYALKNKGVWCEKADGQWLGFTRENTGQQLPSDDFQRIRLIEKSDGGIQVLLISYDGLALIDEAYQLLKVRPREMPYNNYMFNDALFDSQGRYWVGRNNGLEMGDSLFYTPGVSYSFPNQESLPPVETPVTRMLEDRQGNLWFISNAYTAKGIYCYRADGAWECYDLQNLVSSRNQVICLTEDKSGNIWFGLSYGGLLRCIPIGDEGVWTVYSGASLGFASDVILAISPTDDGICFITGYDPGIPGNGTARGISSDKSPEIPKRGQSLNAVPSV